MSKYVMISPAAYVSVIFLVISSLYGEESSFCEDAFAYYEVDANCDRYSNGNRSANESLKESKWRYCQKS